MHEIKVYFTDYKDIKKFCLKAIKGSAVAVMTETFLLLNSSVPDSEKEILISEARAAGKTILINENEGVCDEANLLHK